MAIEVSGFEMVSSPLENGTQGGSSFLHEKENGKLEQEEKVNESIKFGSHGDEPLQGEGNNAVDSNYPKDAAVEWPMPQQFRSFYFVRHRLYEDPAIKAKIDLADKEIQKKNQARFQTMEELKAKRAERAELISQLKSLRGEDRQFKAILNEKTKEIKPLQQALGKLRNTSGAGWGGGICSSEEELDALIRSLQYRIQHESIPLSEEKQILREIKQLEGTREKVIANVAMRAKIQDSLGQKEAIQDQVKLMGSDLDGVRKEQQAVVGKIKSLDTDLKTIDDEIKVLQDELTLATQKKDKAYETIKELRSQVSKGNSNFFKGREIMNQARSLVTAKDVKSLEELCNEEVEKFMSQWTSNKAFRVDYEKRVLQSLDSRQLGKDGRMRNPSEKAVEESKVMVSSSVEAPAKDNAKEVKIDVKSSTQPDTLPKQKAQKEANKKLTDSKSKANSNDALEEEIPVYEKPKNDISPSKEVDAEKLKEMKREEEIAKAKQAMERKKKLAEKAAVKAAIRAQREAEKKLKEREKKAKKKAAAAAPAPGANSEEPDEAVANDSEPEKVEAEAEAAAPAVREVVKKEKTVRHRNRPRGSDSVPKIVLKRKKSSNYWLWAAPAALVVLVLLVLGYLYLL